MPPRGKRNPIPLRNKVRPIVNPPNPHVPEQPVLLPEELEVLQRNKKKKIKHENKKADMPKVWEHKGI